VIGRGSFAKVYLVKLINPVEKLKRENNSPYTRDRLKSRDDNDLEFVMMKVDIDKNNNLDIFNYDEEVKIES
jgi:hypothetical protein